MTNVDRKQKRRAWELAHKILSIVAIIPRREMKELLIVKTDEISKAMGTPNKAKLEDVQRFVFDVIAFMKGYGVYIACGCGYLSLMVCSHSRHEEIIMHRDDTAFTPTSIDDYFEAFVLAVEQGATEGVREICPAKEDSI